MIIELEKFDVVIEELASGNKKVILVTEGKKYKPLDKIDTELNESVVSISRGYKDLFITDKYKKHLSNNNGMTTTMHGGANVCKR